MNELKNMEANGIITREVFATVPPTVEYTLTVKGEKLFTEYSIIASMGPGVYGVNVVAAIE